MNKPLLISLAAAAMLAGSAQAATTTMYERFQAMEEKMKQMQAELETLKAKPVPADETEEEEEEEESAVASAESEEEEEDEDDIEESLDYFDKAITRLNKNTGGNHLKFGVDFRTSYDNVKYKMVDGTEQKNDALLSNRLWLNMSWAATENMSFTGQLAYNKFYGQRSGTGYAPFETFDWITNENPYDDIVRVRSAYYFYRNDTFLGTDIPWTFSLGRRPSTNGHLINYRDDDPAASPMAHTINVEFDGLSSKFSLENLTWSGHYLKFCAGRGLSNATGKFFAVDANSTVQPGANTPYVTNDYDLPDIDMVGLIWVPYSDGQYTIAAQYTYAWNLIDADLRLVDPLDPTKGMTFHGMHDVGRLQTVTANFVINGIGNEWSDFLDDTIFFVSGAATITDPDKDGMGMLGDMYEDMTTGSQTAYESQTGYSAWVGLQIPSLITEGGRWGLEWNYGSQYWRPITYGEDTLIGSKIATRGNAYEVYFTEPLIDDVFSFQLRYTYLDYDYSGSNGFFGSTSGNATKLEDLEAMGMGSFYVDTAQDIRAYLRYRF
jgi:hypothetical protein